MGMTISFATHLTADQLDTVSTKGASARVTSTDEYLPHSLDLNPDLDRAQRDAVELRWSESYPLGAYAYRDGDGFDVEFLTRVSNLSDRSEVTLSAKLDAVVEAVKNHLGVADLPVLERELD